MSDVAEIEQKYAQKVVAIAYDEDGAVYDHCFNWETAQNMALSEGRTIEAIADDSTMTKDEIQALCDAEKGRYEDCFGHGLIPAAGAAGYLQGE